MNPHRPSSDLESGGLERLSHSATAYCARKIIDYAMKIWTDWEQENWKGFQSVNDRTIQPEHHEYPRIAIEQIKRGTAKHPDLESGLEILAKRLEKTDRATAIAIYAIKSAWVACKVYNMAEQQGRDRAYDISRTSYKNAMTLTAMSIRTRYGMTQAEDYLWRIMRCSLPIANPETVEVEL